MSSNFIDRSIPHKGNVQSKVAERKRDGNKTEGEMEVGRKGRREEEMRKETK